MGWTPCAPSTPMTPWPAGAPHPRDPVLQLDGQAPGDRADRRVLDDGTVGHTVRRADLYTALRDEAVRRGVRIHHGRRLVDARAHAGGAVAMFEDGYASTPVTRPWHRPPTPSGVRCSSTCLRSTARRRSSSSGRRQIRYAGSRPMTSRPSRRGTTHRWSSSATPLTPSPRRRPGGVDGHRGHAPVRAEATGV